MKRLLDTGAQSHFRHSFRMLKDRETCPGVRLEDKRGRSSANRRRKTDAACRWRFTGRLRIANSAISRRNTCTCAVNYERRVSYVIRTDTRCIANKENFIEYLHCTLVSVHSQELYYIHAKLSNFHCWHNFVNLLMKRRLISRVYVSSNIYRITFPRGHLNCTFARWFYRYFADYVRNRCSWRMKCSFNSWQEYVL